MVQEEKTYSMGPTDLMFAAKGMAGMIFIVIMIIVITTITVSPAANFAIRIAVVDVAVTRTAVVTDASCCVALFCNAALFAVARNPFVAMVYGRGSVGRSSKSKRHAAAMPSTKGCVMRFIKSKRHTGVILNTGAILSIAVIIIGAVAMIMTAVTWATPSAFCDNHWCNCDQHSCEDSD